jgi:hypothetical protein
LIFCPNPVTYLLHSYMSNTLQMIEREGVIHKI